MLEKLEAVLEALYKACSNVASGGGGVEGNRGVGRSRVEREGITRPEGGGSSPRNENLGLTKSLSWHKKMSRKAI